jgi:serine/tyrosine/threonine adenylyltransferase
MNPAVLEASPISPLAEAETLASGATGAADGDGFKSDGQKAFDLGLGWQPGFAALGSDFYTGLLPEPLPAPYWVGKSALVARQLGLSAAQMDSPALLEALSGNQLLAGSNPLASIYSGHQFGQWAGQLGDGRAILLGTTRAGLEIQLKGAGRTPYSRMGDGRAVLRSSIREFLGSEAMAGLGIPTSRALCVTGSDARVRREEIETAAVVTRVAPSFIRFGHFEHFSHSDQHSQLKALADHILEEIIATNRIQQAQAATLSIANTSPPFEVSELKTSFDNPYANLLQWVSEATAHTVAQWQSVGFCHGVMNTDNMSILGLTIDYGPFQFLDAYVPGHICNHSDTSGRYAFNKQPNIAYWNLYALGQALLPLIGEQELAVAALESYKTVFPAEFERRMAAKLGINLSAVQADSLPDGALRSVVENILKLLAKDRVDYTIFWRRLSVCMNHRQAGSSVGLSLSAVRDLFLDRENFDVWMLQYSELLALVPIGFQPDLMLKINPKYVLRNHLGEEAIRAAKLKDFSGVQNLLTVLETPFDEHPGFEQFAAFPPDWAAGIEISCSS